MNILIKWLMQNKKRRYHFQYVATGFMGNELLVATLEFYVSDREIKKVGVNSAEAYGFFKNYELLSKHFPTKGDSTIHHFKTIDITENS